MMPREDEGHQHCAEKRESGQRGVSNNATRMSDAISMANAMQWVSRITTVVLEMCLPTLAGHWLDEKWGTNFLVLVGLVFGVTLGIYHLILMTNQKGGKIKRSSEHTNPSQNETSPDGDLIDLDKLRDL